MDVTWIGGASNEDLADDVFTLRYNYVNEVPYGIYLLGKTNLSTSNTFRTRSKYRSGSLVPRINGSIVSYTEVTDFGGLENLGFRIPNTEDDGYLTVEYLPYVDDDYYGNDGPSISEPSIIQNYTAPLIVRHLSAIKTYIEYIEDYLSGEDFSSTNKTIFIEDRNIINKEITRSTLEQYQLALLNIAYILDRYYEKDSRADEYITIISSDDSYLLKDKYISEMRQVITILNDSYDV